MAVKDWSATANSNTTIDGINIAEGAPFANMNNMGRAIMANVREEIAEQGTTVTAATLTTISGASQFKFMTGNTTINGWDTAVTGLYREIRSLGTPILKHNATSNINQGGADITLAAGDLVRARSLGAGNWFNEVDRASGHALVETSVATGVGKHMIPFNAEGLVPATTNGPSVTSTETSSAKVNYKSLSYDATTAESAWLKFVAPSSADETRGFTFQYDWTYDATATGSGCAFSMAMLAVGDGDGLDTAVGTAVTVTDAKIGSGLKHTSAESTTVTPAGSWTTGDMLLVKIARVPSDAADTMTGDINLMAVRLFMYTNEVTDA